MTVAKTGSEQRSFQFFRERTLSQLTGFFSEELWDKAIFQVADAEPSIRHAMYALSAFHEHFLLGTSQDSIGEKQLSFAVGQYNLAIKELLRFSDIQDRKSSIIHLVSCLIFISIEVNGLRRC